VAKFLLSLALVVFATRAFCWSKAMEFDCTELGPGASQSYEQTFQVRNKFVTTLVVSVDARNSGTAKVPKCHVKWIVTARLPGRSRVLFQHENNPEYATNGVAFNGTSPDGTKLLLDFFAASGDHTSHHPAVYDFTTNTWQIRDVGTRLTDKLPRCDYFTMIQGVTNDGDVVLYVPKSISVDKGCPDQGEWLLNMKTDTIARAGQADAPPQTQSPR
jgi:hypothetical protein